MSNNLTLGLKNVKTIDAKRDKGYLEITVESNLTYGICPLCKNQSTSIKDYHIHRVIDRPADQTAMQVFVRKRRFRCYHCNKTFTEEIEGLPKGHIYTTEFENFLADLFSYMDYPTLQTHLSKFKIFVPSGSIWYKLKDVPLKFQTSDQEIQNAKYVGLDEFSYSKGHSYGVFAVNIDKHKIVEMVAGGRDQKVAEAALSVFNPATVEACCIDFHNPFKLACCSKFPNASIVVDKFHVIKLLNEAIKNIIKRILPDLPLNESQLKDFNKKLKWLPLKAKENLTEFQRSELSNFLSLNEELKKIYEFKEQFRDLYKIKNTNIAYPEFHRWILHARASKIPELVHVADTYSEWFTFIFNYWYYPISNGITEGKVNKIKLFRRKAYHYKNFCNLRFHVLKSERFNFRR